MTINIGKFGIWRRVGEIDTEMAVEIEDLGYGAIWIGGSPSGDLADVEAILAATRRIPVATGIVNMWREEATVVAESHRRIRSRYPDRFLLGVGIGHPESTSGYSDPLAKINTYLDDLAQGGVKREEHILAALGPKVLQTAANRTAGAHPYLTTPRHTRMAREVMGDGPLLAPEHFVTLDAGREAGRKAVARYLQLDNYRRNLIREGWSQSDLDNDGSDQLIDALVLHGQPSGIREGLQAHLEAGADHVSIQVVSGDPRDAHRHLAAELFG